MAFQTTSIDRVTTRIGQRLADGLAGTAMRLGVPFGPVLPSAAKRLRIAKPQRRRLPGGVARAIRGMAEICSLARHPDGGRTERSGDADLVEARLLASQWQSRAEYAERRIAELEHRLASSEMTALDLRSRLVCLHGKLATSTATARYQVLALALESQGAGMAVDRGPARGSIRV